MCVNPTIRENKKYVGNKKNGGIAPVIKDHRVKYIPTPCGQCFECRRQKANGWRVRLMEEIKNEKKKAHFITFTFSDINYLKLRKEIRGYDGYEKENEIARLAVRRFTERWRKKYKKAPKHWLITELGGNGTENIHLHGIIWEDVKEKEITKIWGYGFGDDRKKFVNERTVNYLVKYVHKEDKKHSQYKSRIFTSKGIGIGYISRESKRNKEQGNEEYRLRNGRKIGLPTYLRNKIWSDEEREEMWIKKLDEQVRWVDGIKIDISKGEEEYYNVLKEAQAKNQRLGFGNGQVNWEKKVYENERRRMNAKKREARTQGHA